MYFNATIRFCAWIQSGKCQIRVLSSPTKKFNADPYLRVILSFCEEASCRVEWFQYNSRGVHTTLGVLWNKFEIRVTLVLKNKAKGEEFSQNCIYILQMTSNHPLMFFSCRQRLSTVSILFQGSNAGFLTHWEQHLEDFDLCIW